MPIHQEGLKGGMGSLVGPHELVAHFSPMSDVSWDQFCRCMLNDQFCVCVSIMLHAIMIR